MMRFATVLTALIFTLAGCSNPTTISGLLSDPGLHDGDFVTVSGTAGTPMAIVGVGGFTLIDGDTSILVLTDRGVPHPGEQVMVHGRFLQAIVLPGIDRAVIVQADTALLAQLLSFKNRAGQ